MEFTRTSAILIRQIKRGEFGWTEPWTMQVRSDGKCVLRSDAVVQDRRQGTVCLLVQRQSNGKWCVDTRYLRYCGGFEWTRERARSIPGIGVDEIVSSAPEDGWGRAAEVRTAAIPAYLMSMTVADLPLGAVGWTSPWCVRHGRVEDDQPLSRYRRGTETVKVTRETSLSVTIAFVDGAV